MDLFLLSPKGESERGGECRLDVGSHVVDSSSSWCFSRAAAVCMKLDAITFFYYCENVRVIRRIVAGRMA